MMPSDRWISLSRRGLEPPRYRITRSSTWSEPVNPWKEKDKLPLLEGGLLGELIYGDEPRIIDDIAPLLTPDDPARIPGRPALADGHPPLRPRGRAQHGRHDAARSPGPSIREQFPERFWISSLFGRATQTLVLSDELKRAYEIVERELKVVADIQRSLLPREAARRSPAWSWRPITRPRSGPGATTTTSSSCPTAAGGS